jgi:F-type H+-transporting ATPase subunit delta
MPLVEKRYAEALIELALQKNSVDVFQQELQSIVNIFNQQHDFKSFFLDPEINVNVKKETMKKLFDGKLSTELVNFLLLLLDKGRTGYLGGICKEYIELADKIKNVLYMTITSAAPIEQSQVNAIKDKYRKLHNASDVKTELVIDKSLIGGIKVKIGDKVIDGSIKGRLESLKELIVNN